MRRLHILRDFDRMGGEIYYREDKFAHDPELLEEIGRASCRERV